MWRHGLAIPACAMVKLARDHATVHYVIIIDGEIQTCNFFARHLPYSISGGGET